MNFRRLSITRIKHALRLLDEAANGVSRAYCHLNTFAHSTSSVQGYATASESSLLAHKTGVATSFI